LERSGANHREEKDEAKLNDLPTKYRRVRLLDHSSATAKGGAIVGGEALKERKKSEIGTFGREAGQVTTPG